MRLTLLFIPVHKNNKLHIEQKQYRKKVKYFCFVKFE